MRYLLRVTVASICLSSFGFLLNDVGDDRHIPGLNRIMDDTDRNYTTVGNIALTVTNFGTIGSRNAYWPDQPSCQYPKGSRIEHIYQGGLWVGAISRLHARELVSTGATDRSSASRFGQGYELNSEAGSVVIQRSSLSESPHFSEDAISHQDFVAEYTDRDTIIPGTTDPHTPMGLRVRQESYAWNFPFADAFVIMNYTIFNVGADTLDSVYVGFWNNGVVRNTNQGFVPPSTPGYFEAGANGLMDTLRMMYTFDYDGIPGPSPANSYIGIKLLGATPFPRGVDSAAIMFNRTSYNAWRFRSSSLPTEYFSPTADGGTGYLSRYFRLSTSLPQSFIAPLRTRRDNITTLLSAGPFATLPPGDSLNIVFGVLCARKVGSDPASTDTRAQRATLIANAKVCQQAYDGEDVNGNNVLDLGEDLNGNLKLDHYLLPQPPRPPKIRVDVGNRLVALYWDKATSEGSIDPISHQADFEGYRVFRSNAGADFTSPEDLLLTLSLVGEFDVPGNNIGYNTGFRAIELTSPKYFPPKGISEVDWKRLVLADSAQYIPGGDTVAYWYKFPPDSATVTHLNGWQYLYGVAAYDRGDSANGITSLQSKVEIVRVVPGALPSSQKDEPIGVYPNPYYVKGVWDGQGERNRKIYFYNLPQRCEIRIYTLAGDVVADFMHEASTYDGTDIEWFKRFGGTGTRLQFSGGEHAWDLITKFDQAIATGLYLFSVKDSETGDIRRGKFLVIK